MPQGDFGDAFGIGIGGTGRYEGKITDNLNWMVTSGYIAFTEKDNSGVTAYMIPINGGVRYYIKQGFDGFYFGGEVGITVVGAQTKFNGATISNSDTKLSIAPQIGYHISVVDFSLRYSVVDEADYLGLRIAYVFGGK